MKTRQNSKHLIYSFVFILFAVLFFYWRIVFKKGFLWEDVLYHYYPSANYFVKVIKSGSFPFWTPFVFAGLPFQSDIQNVCFYPLNYLLLLFPSNPRLSYWWFEIFIIFHIFIGAIGMYLLLKSRKLSSLSSLLGSLIFAFFSFNTLHIIHATFMYTFNWLPFIFLFLLKIFEEKSFSKRLFYSSICGLFIAISILGGSPPVIIYNFSAILVFVLYNLFNNLMSNKRKFFETSFLLIFSFLIGLLIPFVQLYSTWRFLPYTIRQEFSLEEALGSSLGFKAFITLLVPKFFGEVLPNGVNTWWGTERYFDFWETLLYVGVAPLAIFLANLKKILKNRFCVPFLIILIISFLFLLGKQGVVLVIIYKLIPFLRKFRNPGRFSSIFGFSFAFLFAYSFELYKKDKYFLKNLFKVNIGLSLIFLFLFIYHQTVEVLKSFLFIWLGYFLLKKDKFKYLFVILVFLEFYLFGSKFSASNISADEYYPYSIAKELKREKGFYRISGRYGGYMILRRNQGNLDFLELIEGYTPLRLWRYDTFVKKLPREVYLDLLNVKYALTLYGNNLTFAKRSSFLPRFKFYYDWVVADNDSQKINLIRKIDYKNVLVLDRKPPFEPAIDFSKVDNYIKVLKRDFNFYVLEVYTQKNGMLFISEPFVPVFNKAEVDGKKIDIYEAFYFLKAIPVKSGKHLIKIYFDTKIFKQGLIVSFIGIFLFIVGIVLSRIYPKIQGKI